jgi:hypothetical protein
MNTVVKFEIAKLLKEKNVKIDTDDVLFYRDDVNNIEEHQIKNRDVLYNYIGDGFFIPDENEYQTYKISELIMWIYEKHGIWIYAERYSTLFRCYAEEIGDERFGKWEGHKYNSPTEAYEAAIEYTLTKLI